MCSFCNAVLVPSVRQMLCVVHGCKIARTAYCVRTGGASLTLQLLLLLLLCLPVLPYLGMQPS